MTEIPRPERSWHYWWITGVAVALGIGWATYAVFSPSTPPTALEWSEPVAASSEAVHQLCGACHAYPPPDSFPREAWRGEVKRGYDFFHQDPTLRFDYPPLESVVRYYEERAPESLPVLPASPNRPPPITFERRTYPAREGVEPSGVANVEITHLFHQDSPDLVACDALGNRVLSLSPRSPDPAWSVLAENLCCVHAEVTDLNRDGIKDVILAVLGDFSATTDDPIGSVVWLRGRGDGTFEPVTLLDGIGRVADVRAADFTGDGKIDLIVGVFGWIRTGEILLLENRTEDWATPVFTPRSVDERHGTTHVPTADLNGDGKPDFVAVITQEHEKVVAFLNDGGGNFRPEQIYEAPHPGFGSNGCSLVDLDSDGDLDVLLTNGDPLDKIQLLRPYHGIQWLENEGTYPFTPHRLADRYGAGSPVAADFDADGLLDIAFVCLLPGEFFPQRMEMRLDSVVLLRQSPRGVFTPYTLESVTCDHPSCSVGDVNGDGRPDLVVGSYSRTRPSPPGVTVWLNAGSTGVGR